MALSASSGPLTVVPETTLSDRWNSSPSPSSIMCSLLIMLRADWGGDGGGGTDEEEVGLCFSWSPENPDASKANSSPSMGMPTFSGSESDGSIVAVALVAAKGAVVLVAGTFFFFSVAVLGEVAPTSWCVSTRAFSAGGNGAAAADDGVPSPPPCTAGGASWSSMVALAPLE